MEIDPMDNDLDYPDPYKKCKPLNHYESVKDIKMIELDKEIIAIMGRPNFTCAAIGRRLHDLKLYNVAKKSEDEQAAAIHFLLSVHEKHGDKWHEEADKILSDGGDLK